ncbi:BTB/POZ and MATH domain-containing protein 3 [Symbiodinium microadriaticum]|uniref:BTB/POZ and MATH domain-containing protein 3 n=1 Tax=Symbiodinium microadriaticum TaxID=2951 RepID=A0A1Q9CU30_SYMMI|nr:BTB/POZ and MATH domain-containing protein 3 [Symbiodinium microadriaticum]
MVRMSAEELRAEIEATRRRAEAAEAKLPELEAETEQARERLRLREELDAMRKREDAACQRNHEERWARHDIEEEGPQSEPQPGPPSRPPVMEAGGGGTKFDNFVAKSERVWRIEGFSWVPCVLEQLRQNVVESDLLLPIRFHYSPWASYLCDQHHGSLAIVVSTHERLAIRYRIYIKAGNGEFVQWGETCDVVHCGNTLVQEYWSEPQSVIGAYGPDVHWPGHAPASVGIFGLSHQELLQSEWVQNDTLTVKFELEVRRHVMPEWQPLSLSAQVPEPTMSEDTLALFEEGKCSDVRFMVQDEVIQAHSQVLCARSEVFSKQLTAGMLESTSKVIVIEDCDVVTFKAFLQFLYTDRLPDGHELLRSATSSGSGNESGGPRLSQIQALLAVSHKYQVKRLQLWCEAKLSEEIDTSQVCAILCQAHLLQAKQLEKACLEFIKDHPGQVLTLPAYVDLVKKWPQIGLKVHLFSAGVSEAEAQNAIDALEKPQHQDPEQETEAKHSFEMVSQSLADETWIPVLGHSGNEEIKFAKAAMEKAKKSQADQARIKAESEKDLQQTKISMEQDRKSLSDVTMDCKQEAADYQEETKSRGLELEALAAAKAALAESSGLSFLQLVSKSNIKSSEDLKHFEVVHMLRNLGQKLGDHQLVLLSRRMDGMLRTESGADVFSKIKTMITDMITTMKENLQAEATKKAYCDKEMGEAAEKKAGKEADLDDVSTKIDATASKSASLFLHMVKERVCRRQLSPARDAQLGVLAIKSELTTLAETQANMTALRQEDVPFRLFAGAPELLGGVTVSAETSLFKTKELGWEEPETVTGMEGVKSALKALRDFYKNSGIKVTSGERQGAAGGVIGRLEDVEADMAMSLSQMRAAEKTAQMNYERDTQDMKLEKTQKEKDIDYKTAEAQRLDSELTELNSDQESMQTEMGAILEFTKVFAESLCCLSRMFFAMSVG